MFNLHNGAAAATARLVSGLPVRTLPSVSALAGNAVYGANWEAVRTASLSPIRQALDVDDRTAGDIARHATVAATRAYLEALHFVGCDETALRRTASRLEPPRHAQRVLDALQSGRGALLYSGQFSSYIWSLLSLSRLEQLGDRRILILMRPTQHSTGLLARISKAVGLRLEIIDIDSPGAVLGILGCLRSNGVLICLYDFFYDDLTLVVADFFGRPAVSPAGIPKIIAKLDVPYLPFISYFEDNAHRTEVLPRSPAPTVTDMDEATIEIAGNMNKAIEDMVRRRPRDWIFWRGLVRRWGLAQAAMEDGHDA